MKGNLTDAWIDVKGLMDAHYHTWPRHQGTVDITEVIEFARLATEHRLSDKQYEALISKAEAYQATLDRKE